MNKKTCHWYFAVSGTAERLAHYGATLSSTTIFSESDAATATAFCCGHRVARPASSRFFGDGLPRQKQEIARTPLSAMARS